MFTTLLSDLSLYDMIWYFVLFAIVGYILEVIYAALVLGKFVNRGFLSGPWCPIYGFGVLVVAILLKPISDSLIVLFIGSVIVASLIEYLAGYLLEKVFNQKWWDYTDLPFNLNGYICLKFSLLWGVACTLVVELVLPAVDGLIWIIPHVVGLIIIFAILAVMLADLAATIVAIVGIKKNLRLIESVTTMLRENTEEVGGRISKETLAVKEKYDELSKSLNEKWAQRRILTAFPNLKNKSVNEALDELGELLKESGKSLSERSAERHRKVIAKYEAELPEGAEKPFAYSLCFTKLFWLFMIGNVVGFILETFWALVVQHRVELRVGVVWGPFIPVYGFGAVVMTLLLYKAYKRRDIAIFALAAVIGAAFEYLCSLFQELAFGTVSWEYSNTTANIGGRTNLMYGLIWGVLGLLWVKEFYPFISKQIERIPRKVGSPLTVVLCVFMIADMGISGAAVIRRGERMNGIAAETSFQMWLDDTFDDDYLDLVFPNMIYVDAESQQAEIQPAE